MTFFPNAQGLGQRAKDAFAGIFGPGTDAPSYESLQRRRAIADALMQQTMQSPVNNWGDGVGKVMQALGARMMDRRIGGQEDEERDKISEGMRQVRDILSGQGGYGGYSGDPASMSSRGPMPSAQPQAAPQEPFQLQPGQGDFAELFPQVEQQYRLPQGYLNRLAQIESSGDPSAANPNSSAKGLFQFIDSTARQYGVNPMDPVSSTHGAGRLAADNAAHLSQVLGREPTAGELYLAHQQGAGGAAKLLTNPDALASDLVGADAVRLNGGNATMSARDFAGQWTGKFDGGGGYSGGGYPGGGASGPNYDVISQLTELMDNPYMSKGQQAVAQAIIAQQLKGADPMQALQMRQAEQALQLGDLQLRDYGKPEAITPYQRAQLDIEREKMDQPADPTGLQREYAQAQAQGFTGTILDCQTAKAAAGRTNVTVNSGQPADPNAALYAKLDEAEGKRFSTILDTAPQVGRVAQQIGQLEGLLANVQTGGGAALRAKLGDWGIETEGLDDTQALQAAISAMVPGQRPPGSGTMSDADLALFKESIPRLVNQPGGNAKIMATMKAINAYDREIVRIASEVANRNMTPAEGRDAMNSLANPLENFDAPPRPSGPQKVSTQAEFDALPSGTTFVAPDGSIRMKP